MSGGNTSFAQQAAHKLVEGISNDLSKREGFAELWEALGPAGQKEIREAWRSIFLRRIVTVIDTVYEYKEIER